MGFRRAVERYGRTPEPVTPFQRAGQVWDERIGTARSQARNWRLMAFGGLALSACLSGGLLWQSVQSRIVPYVVEIDRFGEARAVADADRDYVPTDPQIAWHLAQFIRDVRSVSLDPVVTRQNWLRAYDFATERGSRFLSDYARDADPFADLGTHSVSVEVTSVVRASERSFQIKWVEQQFERGSLEGSARWTAILTIARKAPRTADDLRKNPLGLFIDAIDWSRELEPSPGGSSLPPSTSALDPLLPADVGAAVPGPARSSDPAPPAAPERTPQ